MTAPFTLSGWGAQTEAGLTADPSALRALAAGLRAAPYGRAFPVRADPVGPVMIEWVEVRRAEGLLRVRIERSTLVIEGSVAALAMFAENLEFLALPEQAGQHAHFEPYEGHAFFAPKSLPLVVARVG